MLDHQHIHPCSHCFFYALEATCLIQPFSFRALFDKRKCKDQTWCC